MRFIPMALTSDAGRSSVSGICKLVNLYPEKNASTSENPVSLISSAGLDKQFVIEGEGGIIGGIETPIGSFFCTRKGFYQIYGKRYVRKASLLLVGRASIACNGLSVMIVDGYNAYVYIVATGKLEQLDIPRSHSVIFLDGYYAISYASSNQWALSGLYNHTFDPLQFAAAEGSYDEIRGLAPYKRQVYIMGGKSCEVWYNSGEDFPFNPNQSAYIDIGCFTPWSYTYNVNGVFWLGDDKIVYGASGYVPSRISTHAIEYMLAGMDCKDSWMVSYSIEGHDFVSLIVPNENVMFVFDSGTGAWHFRESPAGLFQSVFTLGTSVFVGIGDGSVYKMNSNIGTDNDAAVERYCITPSISNAGAMIRVSGVEMAVQYFRQGSEAKLLSDMTDTENLLHIKKNGIELSYTDDDGNSWSAESAAFPSVSNGKYRWNKLGVTYRRSFKFSYIGSLPCVWSGVSLV